MLSRFLAQVAAICMIAFNYESLTVVLLLPVISVDSLWDGAEKRIFSHAAFFGILFWSLWDGKIEDVVPQIITWLALLQPGA
jgi:hypothetical protein